MLYEITTSRDVYVCANELVNKGLGRNYIMGSSIESTSHIKIQGTLVTSLASSFLEGLTTEPFITLPSAI
jgi:hypothetical protein